MRHYVRHYLEMVVGMGVLGMPLAVGLEALGAGDVDSLRFPAMAVAITVPMVGWMLFRGHGRRASAEMSAAMLVPAGAKALRPHAYA